MRRAAVLLVVLACTPDFAPASRVVDLRVLAVQTDPPEAQYDAAGVDPVQVRVLAVDPAQRAPFTVRVRGCAPTDSRRCDSGAVFDRTQPGTELTLALPPSAIAAAQAADKLAGLNGVRLQLELTVDDGDPHGPLFAEKIAVYSPRGTTPNHLPGIDSVELTLDGQPAGTLQPGGVLQLRVGQQLGLRPVLSPGSRETYTTTDLNGRAVTLVEQPRYAFFAVGAIDFDRETADEPLDGVAPPDGLTRIEALRAGQGTLWIVVRDGRGGESWISATWVAG